MRKIEGKNLMLLAVENRQLHIYKLLQDGNQITNNLFDYVDDNGNSVLHLAAIPSTDRPWLDPSAVLQMQWEIKWYEFIKNSVPKYLLNYQNDKGKTPEETFRQEHKELVKSDTEWLNKASESCTIVATLMATVAFATSASVPGSINGKNGEPILKQQRMFEVFASSSLAALCFSLTAVVMFLSILTSRHQIMDFGTDLPRKLLIGLTALFISMASMLVSFCGGHFFVLRDVLRDAWIAEYLVVFLPITIFAMAQLPLYAKLVFGSIKKMMEMPETDEKKEIKSQLFRHAMKGEWKEVVEIYKKNAEVHVAKITKSGDTALHLAVSDGQVQFVKLLVDTIYNHDGGGGEGEPEDASVQVEEGLGGEGEPEDPSVQVEEGLGPEALTIKNERGNTPLHLAAASGSFEMCYWIAIEHPNLIFIRNNENMNPLFLAALNGKKDAFLCLDNLSSNKKPLLEYCRGSNGDTFLHAALNGEYFALNLYNEKGFTPLHVLATKPSSFKSTFVEELKEDKRERVPKPESQLEKQPKLPENYQACFFIYGLYQKVVRVIHTKKNNGQQQTKGKSKDTGNNNTHHKIDLESPDMKGCKIRNFHEHDIFPPNYKSCFEPVKLMYKAFLIILGCGGVGVCCTKGSRNVQKVLDKKKQHVWTVQILNNLLPLSMTHWDENNGQKPQDNVGKLQHPEDNTDPSTPALDDQTKNDDQHKNETPILVAAKYGIIEIVEKVLEQFPVAIHDTNSDEKNIVLLAVENRQTNVYKFLLERSVLKDSIFSKVDKDGNSAVHLAAKIGEYRPWLIPGAALQMQWEIKWYEFVKYSMALHFFVHYNKANETPKDIFTKSHKDLVKQGGEWLTTTSNSCSVVAALIATVAFATASSVPGGNSSEGKPTLENQPAFNVFAIASLVALCFSVTALVMFLAILTSRNQERDFRISLPRKLLLGLTSLFVSITAMLVSFCAGHFFVLKDELKFVAIPVYAVTCLPVTFFAIAQFPLYFDLIWAMFKNVPQRSYRLVAQ
ncbi:unnamed protein product [Camellia sinensis]